MFKKCIKCGKVIKDEENYLEVITIEGDIGEVCEECAEKR